MMPKEEAIALALRRGIETSLELLHEDFVEVAERLDALSTAIGCASDGIAAGRDSLTGRLDRLDVRLARLEARLCHLDPPA
jgi:hypothetical protein